MSAHSDVLTSLQEMGAKLARSLDDDSIEKKQLQSRIDAIGNKWSALVSVDTDIRYVYTTISYLLYYRNRLESAQEQWERLTGSLGDLIYWTEAKSSSLLEQQPIGGDLVHVREQNAFVKVYMRKNAFYSYIPLF